MPAPFDFPSTTPSANLPLLFAGQSQKEFFVNQALSIIDALIQKSVVASRQDPPTSAAEGSAYRVTSPAAGEWIGEEGSIALRIGGAWHYVSPHTGMQIFDQEAGQMFVYRGEWETASAPPAPSGGAVIDVEARAAIGQMTQALTALGFFE